MKVRSMRDIPTIQGLRNRSVPTAREQVVTELARLEHEKARLERELKMWTDNQKKTGERLRLVEERLALLQETLEPAASNSSPRRAKSRRTPMERVEGDADEAPGWHEIPLEY
ncbi:MAG: hypothetical protein M5U01_33005 [Ardenticatenaceae bacterium]|nr:hypothetical protein [Ardenticatenaceae bacterium]HBY99591.1 hypothetical protein [Chloroflexota bacterium]